MPRKAIGERPMTNAERQSRQRDKLRKHRTLAREAIEFLRSHEPRQDDSLSEEQWHTLRDLQRKIRILYPI
jgi:hypothetical protein